jgi:lipid-A-disaccharide synthase
VTRILVSAGEPSGDAHAATVISAILQIAPETQVEAIGGPEMARTGVPLLERIERLSATGLVEAAGRAPVHVRLLRELTRRIKSSRYELVLLVDYPGFHLRLARVAASAGVPVLYYIAPQLWAWGAWRIRTLRRSVRHLAVILPFEESFFAGHDVRTTFVGHPLLDRSRELSRSDTRTSLGIDPSAVVLALFPGSRPHELERHLPLFASTARQLQRTTAKLQVVVAATQLPNGAEADVCFHVADSRAALAVADVALCKAGTTTLEAALANVPFVIAHRMHPLTFLLARRVVQVPHVGLVNVLAGRPLVPEFLQSAATPDALAAALATLLDTRESAAHDQRAGFASLRPHLGKPGAGRRVAALALDLVA